MATRSNVVIVNKDGKAHQFYHHWDGYLSGVGDELRNHLVYSIGMSVLLKDVSAEEVLIGELASADGYEDEYTHEFDSHNRIHTDVEFTYVVKDSKLYYVYKFGLCEKVDTYSDLIDYVCKDENEIDLTHPCKDED